MVTNVNVHQEHLGRDVSANHVPALQTLANRAAVFQVQVQAMDSSVDVTKDGTVNIVTFQLVTIPCVKMVASPCQTSSHIRTTHHVGANVLRGSPDDTVRILLFVMLLILVKMAVNATLSMEKTLGVSVKMALSGNFVNDNQILAKTIHVSMGNVLLMKTTRLNAYVTPIGLVQTVILMLTSAPLVVTILVNMEHVLMKRVVTDVNVILVSKVIDVKLTLTIVP